MEYSHDIPQEKLGTSSSTATLKVDFRWTKLKAHITTVEADIHDPSTVPVYTLSFQTLKSPHLIFHPGNDTTSVIGTGTIHAISINPDYELHGKPGTIKALRRFHTVYEHISSVLRNPGGAPMPMTWTSDTNFKTWDFVCVDDQQNPVAKFSTNIWMVKKVGNIEFMDKNISDELRDEIVVTGLTLYYCMATRVNNIFNLFGAVFSRPGRHSEEEVEKRDDKRGSEVVGS
ncbi:uncharacterized protein Z518_10231 [Rhinocladiella mackenziei CBS 650.93]|uniref:Uncharacterized protein n=1 Tax=Rhinocladiella mackenziei CBS 650.93 TaxID=1442369 RepID=A0A0D2I2V9_9EURO|nr:uncharacterized protein Z518_10231 [Rhinocladiella mackenziei CBS 650.93]KIX00094.1 hypothetical protein Z518_10231 [Rhinocladiella mackenziei CBS 650.93]